MDLTEDEPLRFETAIEGGAPIVGNAPCRGVPIPRTVVVGLRSAERMNPAALPLLLGSTLSVDLPIYVAAEIPP